MPLVNRTFSQLIDFTRTSAATYVDASGRIVPTPASRNLLTFTQEFDNGVWTKGEVTVAANSATAPDGTLTADKLVATTAAAYHGVSRVFTLTNATAYTYSFYAKASEYSLVRLAEAGNGAFYASFNLSTQSVVSGDTGGGQFVSASISNVGNGWFRCSVAFINTSGSVYFALAGYPAGATVTPYGVTYTGDGTSGVFLWGAQLEAVPDANLTLGSEVVTVNSATLTGATGYTAITGSAVVALAEYLVTYTCTLSGGTIQAVVGGTALTSVSASGTYRAIVTAGATTAPQFYSSAATGSISNFSVKQITGTTGMPTDYTRNNGGVYPPRFDYDPVTLAPRGLLVEEQRTNLFTYSEQFDGPSWTPTNLTVTANSTTSPDGTVDADTLNEGTATGVHSIAQVFSATTGTSYALSVYLKNGDARYAQLFFGSAGHGSTAFANFDLQAGTVGTVGAAATASIQPAGNGWYRCTIVAAATATTASASAQVAVITSSTSSRAENYTGASKFFYAWGIQTEAGAFATSYIPTVASQVTRTADVATITGANFSQWYSQSAGTFVVDFDVLSTTSTSKVTFATHDGTSSNTNNSYVLNGGTVFAEVRNGGSSQAALNLGSATANTVFKSAFAYSSNDFAGSGNGGTVATDTSGAVALSQNVLNIGHASMYGGLYLNGHIRSIRFYPVRLSNAQLQALTA